jgi:hypothetical protein
VNYYEIERQETEPKAYKGDMRMIITTRRTSLRNSETQIMSKRRCGRSKIKPLEFARIFSRLKRPEKPTFSNCSADNGNLLLLWKLERGVHKFPQLPTTIKNPLIA